MVTVDSNNESEKSFFLIHCVMFSISCTIQCRFSESSNEKQAGDLLASCVEYLNNKNTLDKLCNKAVFNI